ncbi:MAG TPA: hypothetical protein VKN63_01285 [Afifellaceae bacterium]|nr:hypothetical protein [Afifellaceae bacterium]
MIRWIQIGSIAAVAVAALLVFQLKYRAEAVSERVAKLQKQVDAENEANSLLKAEWSYLIQPSRIQALVERHKERLQLQPMDPEQITHLDTIPARPVGLVSADNAPLSANGRNTNGGGQ